MQSSNQFVKKYFRKLSGWSFVLLFIFLFTLGLFIAIMHEVIWQKEELLDLAFFNYLAPHISPERTEWMKQVTYCASGRFLQGAYLLLIVVYFFQKNWKRGVEILVIGVGGFLVNYFMKLSFQRLRPPNPLIDPLHNFSFPSGHATSAFIFYGLLVYLVYKAEKLSAVWKGSAVVLLIAFSLLIGFSRIYLRVHYLSDVLAGFCIGLAWLTLCIWMMERLKKESGKEIRKEQLAPSTR